MFAFCLVLIMHHNLIKTIFLQTHAWCWYEVSDSHNSLFVLFLPLIHEWTRIFLLCIIKKPHFTIYMKIMQREIVKYYEYYGFMYDIHSHSHMEKEEQKRACINLISLRFYVTISMCHSSFLYWMRCD